MLAGIKAGDLVQFSDTQWAIVWQVYWIEDDIVEVITDCGEGKYGLNGDSITNKIDIIEVTNE